MSPTRHKFGIPDIDLRCASGTNVNPSSFAGHDLIVLFCPVDEAEAAREIAEYRKHCAEFVERDAWLLTFADDLQAAHEEAGRLLVIPDPGDRAWVAFRDLTGHAEEFDRGSGATFLFTRGGNLHGHWHGAGHLHEVLEELTRPAFEHSHQFAG